MPTRTIPVSGNGSGTLTFQNPGPDVLAIESVLALIDTGGAGDTTATLTVTSPAGNDVAAIPQGAPVSGGGQGRATWALRLAEDAAGGGGGVQWVLANYAVNATPTPAFSQDYRYDPAIPPLPVYGVGASWFHVRPAHSDFRLDAGSYLLFVTFAFGEPRIFGSVVSSPIAGGTFTLLGVVADWTCWLVQNPNMGESVRMETHSAVAPGGATSSILALVRLSPDDGLP